MIETMLLYAVLAVIVAFPVAVLLWGVSYMRRTEPGREYRERMARLTEWERAKGRY